MEHRSPQAAFPIGRTLVWLSAMAAGLFAVCAWLVPAVWGQPIVTLPVVGFVAALVWTTGLLSVLPVTWLGPAGVQPTVYGYFIGAGARLVVCLGAAVVAVKRGGMPLTEVFILLLVMYLPMLFLEAGLVGRYLWHKTSSAPGRTIREAHA